MEGLDDGAGISVNVSTIFPLSVKISVHSSDTNKFGRSQISVKKRVETVEILKNFQF